MTYSHSFLGVGIAYHSELGGWISDHLSELDVVEFVVENLRSPSYYSGVSDLRGKLPLIAHGVSASLGGEGAPSAELSAVWRWAVEKFSPVLCSEHLAYCSAGDASSSHLLPVRWSRDKIQRVAANVRHFTDTVGRPISLENIAYYFPFPGGDMAEVDFLSEIVAEAGCGVLLDLQNLVVNSKNHDFNAQEYLNAFPLQAVTEVHVTGGRIEGNFWVDSHSAPVPDEVWQLLGEICVVADPRAVIIERDANFDDVKSLESDIQIARGILTSSRLKAEARPST